jgi:RNA polymerase sigma factor (sigma-70 family)
MSAGQVRPLNQQLDRLWQSGTVSGLDDAELIRRFSGPRTPAAEQAFENLVDRHGPMVLAVCRAILRRPQDADDAFQATFLVLVRKAGSIRLKGSLAPWLYAVAYRTATRLRSQTSRLLLADPGKLGETASDGTDPAAWEVGPMVHQELARLPEKYRTPIVLCHLEGKSHEEAARLLDWPIGTLSGRLSRGRQVLKGRLERRGLSAPVGMLLPPFPGGLGTVPPAGLVASTLEAALGTAAAGSLPSFAHTLSMGVTRAMFQTKVSRWVLALASISTLSAAVVLRPIWLPSVLGGDPPAAKNPPALQPANPPADEAQLAQNPGLAPQVGAPGAMAPTGAMMAGGNGGMGGGMGGMMAGMMGMSWAMKNSPNLADLSQPIPLLRMGQILVVETDDGKGLAAMNTQSASGAEWKRYDCAPGVSALPIGNSDVLTFAARGESVAEVAAFSAYHADWVKQRLLNPVREQISPAVGRSLALFQEGNNFYAFSASAGKWDVLKLDGGEKARATLDQTDITVQQGNRVYVFPLQTARWSKGIAVKRPAGLTGAPAGGGPRVP